MNDGNRCMLNPFAANAETKIIHIIALLVLHVIFLHANYVSSLLARALSSDPSARMFTPCVSLKAKKIMTKKESKRKANILLGEWSNAAVCHLVMFWHLLELVYVVSIVFYKMNDLQKQKRTQYMRKLSLFHKFFLSARFFFLVCLLLLRSPLIPLTPF